MGYTFRPEGGGEEMPWKERSVMDERMRFVIRLKDGETMASLCREFGISRQTGYKIFERYEQCGLEGLSDRVRRPFRYANQLPAQLEAAIVSAKREKPHWGARKIRERLLRRLPHAIKVPAASTVHAVLDRHGLVTRATRSRTCAEGTPPSADHRLFRYTLSRGIPFCPCHIDRNSRTHRIKRILASLRRKSIRTWRSTAPAWRHRRRHHDAGFGS